MNNADALQNILAHAEGLNMPEGDYLRVANALRDAFHAGPAVPRPRYRYVMDRKVKVSFWAGGQLTTFHLVRQTRTDSGNTGPDTVTCEYRINARMDGTDDLHIVNTHFRAVINSLLWLHKPKSVTIESHMGKSRVTYAQTLKDNLKQIEEVKRRLAIPDLDEDAKENLEETLHQIIDFNYTDFTAEVARRIPDVESYIRL